MLLIALGIVGAFVPILQGWPFVILGLGLLARHNRFARLVYERLKRLGRWLRNRVIRRGKRKDAANRGDRGEAATSSPDPAPGGRKESR